MKKIQPITIWVAGQEKIATLLGLSIVYDNLIDSATFCYALYSSTEEGEAGENISSGNLAMTPAEYAAWDESTNVNQAAYEWTAGKLNLTLAPNQSY